MGKRIPAIACSEENCGELFDRCGKISTYTNKKCRCDACRAADRAYKRKYSAANREKRLAYQRRYREANRESLREIAKARRQENPEHFRELERKRRENKPDEYRETQRRWREANLERVREIARQHYHRNADRYRENRKLYEAENRQARAAYFRRYHQENPQVSRDNARNRRALLLNAFIEHVDELVVFERDDWTCQDCGRKCSREAKWPDPAAASVDHIIPLSWGVFWGGFHSYANTQLLCLACNWSKNNRYKERSAECLTS